MKRSALVLAPVIAALAIAGCGGSSNSNGSTTTTSSAASSSSASSGYGAKSSVAPAAAGGATVAVKSTGLGNVLVDGKGKTLYLFEADKGTSSTCYGACAGVWPPLIANGAPMAGTNAKAALLGTTKRKDGKLEVTYKGHPLYYYAGDNAAGDTKGQGLDQFGAEWYVLGAGGGKVEDHDS